MTIPAKTVVRWSMAIFVAFTMALATNHLVRTLRPPPPRAQVDASAVFPSGRQLVVYALLASDCGFCAMPETKQALGRVRDSVRAGLSSEFSDVEVIGVAMDTDIRAGFDYLRSIGELESTFDQVAIGGSWMNEFVNRLVWTESFATAATPTLVLTERELDSRGYPKAIAVGPERLLFVVQGRDSLLAWIGAGAPVSASAPSAAASGVGPR